MADHNYPRIHPDDPEVAPRSVTRTEADRFTLDPHHYPRPEPVDPEPDPDPDPGDGGGEEGEG